MVHVANLAPLASPEADGTDSEYGNTLHRKAAQLAYRATRVRSLDGTLLIGPLKKGEDLRTGEIRAYRQTASISLTERGEGVMGFVRQIHLPDANGDYSFNKINGFELCIIENGHASAVAAIGPPDTIDEGMTHFLSEHTNSENLHQLDIDVVRSLYVIDNELRARTVQ